MTDLTDAPVAESEKMCFCSVSVVLDVCPAAVKMLLGAANLRDNGTLGCGFPELKHIAHTQTNMQERTYQHSHQAPNRLNAFC